MNGFMFRQSKKKVSKYFRMKMDNCCFSNPIGSFTEIYMITAPHMSQIRAPQDHVSRFKPICRQADKLGSHSVMNMNEFQLFMKMPTVIKIGNPVKSDIE